MAGVYERFAPVGPAVARARRPCAPPRGRPAGRAGSSGMRCSWTAFTVQWSDGGGPWRSTYHPRRHRRVGDGEHVERVASAAPNASSVASGSARSTSSGIGRMPGGERRSVAARASAVRPGVAVVAEVVQHGPGRRHGAARLRAEDARRAVGAAEPAVGDEHLVAPQLPGAVDDHGGALGRVAELVEVDRDRRDAIDGEVPRRDRLAEPREVGERDPAHAGVDVAADVPLGGERGDRRDRVDHALRVLRRGADDEHGAVVDRGSHRVDVGPPVGAAPGRARLSTPK